MPEYLQKNAVVKTIANKANDIINNYESSIYAIFANLMLDKVDAFGTSYYFKNFTFESGVNNLLNEKYFTRRATGYPGPGIIPSSPRTFYFTMEIKI